MKNQRGQSLVEALIALGAAVIIVSAITVAAITAVNNADFSKYQNLATHYAQQGLEILRQNAQTDWATFSAKAGNSSSGSKSYCLDQDSTILSPLTVTQVCNPNITNEKGTEFFVREVTLFQEDYHPPADPSKDTYPCNGNIRATIDVSWSDGKCNGSVYCHTVTLDSCFANINGVPAP